MCVFLSFLDSLSNSALLLGPVGESGLQGLNGFEGEKGDPGKIYGSYLNYGNISIFFMFADQNIFNMHFLRHYNDLKECIVLFV